MEELNKKKVPELKQALKERGLPISGTKSELVKRLLEAGGLGGEPSIDDSLQDIDEDDILNEEPSPVKSTQPPKAPVQTTKVSVAADSATSNGDSTAAREPAVRSPNAGDSHDAAKPAEVSKLTDAERLKLRAEKFGIVSEKAKKDLRAQRFGLSTASSGLNSSEPVNVDVLKKRAERFGTVVASSLNKADEAERKRKRAERFGTTGSVTSQSSNGLGSTEEEIKKKKRAERFGLAT